MKKYSKSGFTLVEIVLVFVLIGILIAITTPLVVETIERADLTTAHESLYNSLLRAQKLAQSQANGQSWGVCIDTSNSQYIIAATSTNCNSRNTIYDEIIKISPNITIISSDGDALLFNSITGLYDGGGYDIGYQGIIILRNGKFSKTITIGRSGIIDKK